MSVSWHQRKIRLAALLKSQGDEDADGLALDRLMHGQNIIGKTSKTTEVDGLRFKNKDLETVGTLEYGQFGVIDVVTCRLNNCVYVRKSIEKRFALRTRDQCSPQFERDLLLQAVKTDSPWAPHLLCAFQTPTHLNLVMDYAEGGTLWDVLESSPHDGRIPESDLKWWVPQVVSAIHWCHSQGFAHRKIVGCEECMILFSFVNQPIRDIKPHNFVLTPDAHILLIDFGSAAPLLPPKPDGSQIIPRRYCLVPCGTCDYISPEILQAHEEALVALEMDGDDSNGQAEQEGYGVETDWWSLGAMLYEMAYGMAPFFANDIKQTYIRIMNHEKSLRFDQKVEVSHEFQHFLRRLLTNAKQRLGRRNVMEITDHPLFDGVDWTKLISRPAPPNLHLPQFTYSAPKPTEAPTVADPPRTQEDSASLSQGFAFSAFFQQSSSTSPGLSILRPSPGGPQETSGSAASFIGFSWGPTIDAFPEDTAYTPAGGINDTGVESTPRPLLRASLSGPQQRTPVPENYAYKTLSVPSTWGRAFSGTFSTPQQPVNMYSTPMKPYALSPYATLPRTSTIRRTAPRRMVSDREAMKQLVDCVGMSARKKVLESGRKPRVLAALFDLSAKGGSTGGRSRSVGTGFTKSNGYGTLRKELRFDRFTTPIPGPDYSAVDSSKSRGVAVVQASQSGSANDKDDDGGHKTQRPIDDSDIYYYSQDYNPNDTNTNANPGRYSPSDTSDSSEGGHPPSPSPSPRPGSAMSMMSMTMLSRRSGTPTTSGYFGSGRMRSGSGSLLPFGDRSATVTTTGTGTSSGLLSIPSAGVGNLEFGIKDVGINLREEAKLVREPPALKIDKKKSQKASVSAVVLPASYESQSRATEEPKGSDIVPSHSRHLRTRTLDDIFPDKLCDMERRHTNMMRDIEDLEGKLAEVSSLVV